MSTSRARCRRVAGGLTGVQPADYWRGGFSTPTKSGAVDFDKDAFGDVGHPV